MPTPAPVLAILLGRSCRPAAGLLRKAGRTPRPRASVPSAGEA
ncbi:hypothetical protein ACFVFS_22510 [Kitasatospora sp. NPDC057692]